MSFSPSVITCATKVFLAKGNEFRFVPLSELFNQLRKKREVNVAGLGKIPFCFYQYLQQFGLKGKKIQHFVKFCKICPKSVEKLKRKYYFDLLSLCKAKNRRVNRQVFLFHLIHKFSGTSARARTLLNSSFLELSSSTFYNKQIPFCKEWIKFLLPEVESQGFFVWMDNFTKINRVDWLCNEEEVSYQIHDLSVVALFKPALAIPPSLFRQVFEERTVRQFHSNKIFRFVGNLVFEIPTSFHHNCNYNTSQGFFPFVF